MKKKGYIILVSVLLLGVILGVGRAFYDRYKINKLERNVIEEYGFEISYPITYKDVSETEENQILSNVTMKESGEQLSEYMQNLNFAETVRNLKNELTGIRLIVEAIDTEKTTLSLDEICKRYIVMFQIYNEEAIISESNTEKIILDGKETGKVTIKIKGENDNSVLIVYLMSLEDREITVTFIGNESTIKKFENEINKIINSLKVY